MQVLLADEYGFCFGVERAVEMVENAIDGGETVRSLGPLIHNDQEMQRLGLHGVTTISDPVQIGQGETAVIRALGVTPQVQKELEEKATKVVDATCPFVTRVQKLAARAAQADRHVIVVGSPDHPEMIGVKGYAPDHAFVTHGQLSGIQGKSLICRGSVIRSSCRKPQSKQRRFSTPLRP